MAACDEGGAGARPPPGGPGGRPVPEAVRAPPSRGRRCLAFWRQTPGDLARAASAW